MGRLVWAVTPLTHPHWLTHSLTHSLTYLHTHSLAHQLIHSFIHSLTSLTYSLTHSLTYSLTHCSLTHSGSAQSSLATDNVSHWMHFCCTIFSWKQAYSEWAIIMDAQLAKYVQFHLHNYLSVAVRLDHLHIVYLRGFMCTVLRSVCVFLCCAQCSHSEEIETIVSNASKNWHWRTNSFQ